MNGRSLFCHGEERSDVAIHELHVDHVFPTRGLPQSATPLSQ